MAMLRHPSGVWCRRRPQFQRSSPLKLLIKAKLHVEHPYEGGTKVYINDPGHMTKMAAMAINS